MTAPSKYEIQIEALHRQFKELAPTGQAIRPPYIAGVQIDVTPEQSAYWVALKAIILARSNRQPTPAWARAVECDVALGILERLRREFLATRNAMCACEAYRIARKFGIELPDWIVTWLDRGFEDFWAKAACEGETVLENSRVALKMLPANCPRPTQTFAKAFGVKDSAWRKYYPTFWRFFGQQVELAAWEDHQAGKPIKEIAIISRLAEEWAVSSAAAWRIWARFKKCYPEKVAWMPSQARGRRRRRGA